MQKASRSDALGNVIRYDDAANAFVTDLTPLTQATLDAQQNELLRSLREDAPRNRAAAERRERRSQQAEEQFEDVFNQYRFRPQTSEATSIADATQELLSARREGLKQAQGDITRQLLRTGGSSNIGAVAQALGDQYADSLANVILEGKRVGSQRFRDRESADTARFMQELQGLRGIADDVVMSNIGRSSANEELTGRADAALQQLVAAISGGGDRLANIIGQGDARRSSATQALMSSIARGGLDLSGVASALSRLSFDNTTQQDPSQPVYDPWAGLREVTV